LEPFEGRVPESTTRDGKRCTTMKGTEMKLKHLCLTALLLAAAWTASAGAAGWNPQGESEQLEAAAATIAKFKATDTGLEDYFKKAYGYAVFPTIGSGGFIFSGAYGTGTVYEKGVPVGSASVTQASVGFTIGGQSSSELLFFRDKAALENFQTGNYEFSAQASAVIARQGAAAKSSYDNTGVAVFVHVKGGAMLEASIGGQKFAYKRGLGN
jgi:lipid-binding SYLF domain-containing protein